MPHKGSFKGIQQAQIQAFMNAERQKKRKIKEIQQRDFDVE